MKKLLLAIILLFSTIGLIGCTDSSDTTTGTTDSTTDSSTSSTVKLTVWVSSASEAITREMLEDYKALNPDTNYEFTIGTVSEADAKTEILKDVDAAADVFAFAQDHLEELVTAGAISQIGGTYKTEATEANTADSIAASTIDDKLYAFPMTADNGYFMYYDKRVFTNEADLLSIESMIATAQADNGKKVFLDMGNGFYTASLLFATGNRMDLTDADFDDADGIKVAEAMQALINTTGFSKTATEFPGGMGTTLAAGVGGTWNAADIITAIGEENMGCTKLPTIKIDGVDTQLASFAGYKLIGVKAGSSNAVEANKLALFLSNEENQLTRFEELGFGPSNVGALANEEVVANVPLTGLAAQSPYSVPQTNVPGTFWDACTALSNALETPGTSTVEEILAQFMAAVYPA